MSFTPPLGPATPSTRGTIKLSGDIGGTADAPVVRNVVKQVNGVAPDTQGNVIVNGGTGPTVVTLTQAEYDALSTYDPDTLYVII